MIFMPEVRLQQLSDCHIGLESQTVRLEPFHPEWKRLYASEAYFIYDTLKIESLRLYHCGSTAVVGLDAKPILDIVGSAPSLEVLDQQKDQFESIGYEYKGEYGIPGRRFCALYNPEKSIAYVHMHLFQHGHPEIEKHLLFRDTLRSSSEAKEAYLKHKKYLVEIMKVSRDKYPAMKSDVIMRMLSQSPSTIKPTKKICAILGAAGGHQNTLKFLQEFYAGQLLEIIDLNHFSLAHYSYSYQCCDDFSALIYKILESDLLVLATPVYWYTMSGVMKIFLDRLTDLLDGELKPLGEALNGKKVQLLATGGNLKLPIGFEVPFTGTAIYLGMDYMGAIYRQF